MNRNNFVDELSVILVKNHFLPFTDAQILRRAFQQRDDIAFEDFLLEEGVLDRAQLLEALSEYYKVPSFDVMGVFFDHHVLRLFPKDVLLDHLMIPYDRFEDTMVVIAANPNDPHLRVVLGKYVTHDVDFMVGLPQDIHETIDEFYDRSDTYQPNDIANQLMERSMQDVFPPGRTALDERIPLIIEETIDDYESK
jgi:hypothetical protein